MRGGRRGREVELDTDEVDPMTFLAVKHEILGLSTAELKSNNEARSQIKCRSLVWNYFKKGENPSLAVCGLCSKAEYI